MKLIMKPFIILVLLFSSIGLYSHNITSIEAVLTAKTIGSPSKTFSEVAKENKIATRKILIPGISPGYYLISGVFSKTDNLKKNTYWYLKKGLNAGFFQNPENNLHYQYLDHFQDWSKAIDAHVSQLQGAYRGDLWIAEINSAQIQTSNDIARSVSSKKDKISEDSGKLNTTEETKVLTRKITVPAIESGYYLISGVFSKTKNLRKNTKKYLKKGLNAGFFKNPENELHYQYLGYYHEWSKAVDASISQLNGVYHGDLWIAEINSVQIRTSPLKTLRSSIKKDPPILKKLLKRADEYFAKMWYKEASKLYEEVLERDPNPSIEVLEKAGDAYYFNTNMDKAYAIYNRLYELQEDNLSSAYLFKYAHALKGTGKYGRAKRLMKLYNKAKASEKATKKPIRKSLLLDEILSKRSEFEIKNLAINSKYSEFSPAFHEANKIVYASAQDSSFFSTRRYKWNNQPYLDLYVAKINEESQDLRDATKFSKKINTKYHEASVAFSPDNRTMYFTRNNYGKKLKRDTNGVNNLKIYKSTKQDGEWTTAVELPFNSDEYSTGHPTLSPDGKKLYFVSDMPGTIGKTDIFVVDVLESGGFSTPRNLGPDINTEQREMFPFISENTLYFSSDGHVGLGGLDVYRSKFDEEGFQEVQNMGQPINSKLDDFSYIVNDENQLGYFASNRKGGKGDDDIYAFKRLLVEEIETNKNAIAGIVLELVTGDLVPEAMVTLLDENNRKLKEMVTQEDGSFVFEDLESNTKYTIRTTKGDYFEEEQVVVTKDNERVSADISLKRLKELIIVENGIRKLKTDLIYFNFDKWNIRNDASLELDKVIEVMQQQPNMVIKIESHTDARGNRAYNKYLSDKRAKSTRDYLVSKGIDANRIESAIGYGEEQLINACSDGVRCSRKQHELNRRSEIIIVKM